MKKYKYSSKLKFTYLIIDFFKFLNIVQKNDQLLLHCLNHFVVV